MSGSDNLVRDSEMDNPLQEDAREDDPEGNADSIICTVTVQSSSNNWSRSLTIPG